MKKIFSVSFDFVTLYIAGRPKYYVVCDRQFCLSKDKGVNLC